MKREIPDIALTLTPGIGPKGAVHLLDVFGSAEAVFSASADELIEKARLRPELARAILQKKAFADAEREVKHCRKHGIEIIASTDAQYPALLRETADYPHVLYVLGSPEALGKTTLTMVGTRRMTPYGQQMADRLIGELADRVADTVIVSGLAFGIDTACHRAALAFGMPTVGIIASALPGITPAQHTAVARDMIEHGGAVVSELHSQTRQNGNFYHSRNRLLAGISGGTVVVESPVEGGSMDTARLQPHADGRPWTRDGLRLGRSQSADSDPACPNGMHGRRYRAGNDVGPEPPRRSDRPADSGSRSTHARRRGAAGLLPHRRPDIRRRALRTLGARIRRTFGPAAGTRNGRSRPAASGEPIYETTLIKNKYKIHYPNPMKQFVILFLLFTISPISFTFAQNKIFCEIIEQIVSQKKTRIYLDYGQERNKKKDIRLENENEKAEIFYSRVEALNIMSALGWKFEQAYVKVSGSSGNGYGSTSSTTHYLLSKDVDSIQEINNIIDEIKAKKSELNNIPTESEQRDTNSINKIF